MPDSNQPLVPRRDPWNKGRLIGQKRPLKPKDVWSIRVRLQVEHRARNLALFNLAIDIVQKKTAVRCNSRSPSRPEPRSRRGLSTFEAGAPGTSFPAGSERSRTCRPAVCPDRPFLGRERWAS